VAVEEEATSMAESFLLMKNSLAIILSKEELKVL